MTYKPPHVAAIFLMTIFYGPAGMAPPASLDPLLSLDPYLYLIPLSTPRVSEIWSEVRRVESHDPESAGRGSQGRGPRKSTWVTWFPFHELALANLPSLILVIRRQSWAVTCYFRVLLPVMPPAVSSIRSSSVRISPLVTQHLTREILHRC